MKITFHGAAKIVTGSCYLCEVGRIRFLVDCGLFQGTKDIVRLNYLPFNFNPKDISFVLLTHAHLDHCGLIPKLVSHGFKGKVYTTPATRDLCRIMLEDSANIQKESTEHENKRCMREGLPAREPLYLLSDARRAMKQLHAIPHDKLYYIGGIKVCFRNAGHILGSSIVVVHAEGSKLVFSGDLGQDNALILRDPERIEDADYLFIESTYGDRLHLHVDRRQEKLARVINETYKKGGILIIPTFAVERTQELIFSIEQLYKKKLIPHQKVFLDSPLGIRATEIFRKHPEEYEERMDLNFKDLVFSLDVKSSIKINSYTDPAIVMAGSGMCNAGRVRHHIKHRIWDPRNTMLFVGYQAKGTLGQVILSGEKNIRMMGMNLVVKAKIESLDSFSGHADKNMLLRWVKCFTKRPKRVFVIHGEEQASIALSKSINELGMKTTIPELGQTVDL